MVLGKSDVAATIWIFFEIEGPRCGDKQRDALGHVLVYYRVEFYVCSTLVLLPTAFLDHVNSSIPPKIVDGIIDHPHADKGSLIMCGLTCRTAFHQAPTRSTDVQRAAR